MALIIRMRQQGAKSRQHFRIVVTDSRHPRDGKYVEKLGWYNPFGPDRGNYSLDVPRVQHWLSVGAEISDRVKALLGRQAPEILREMGEKKVARLAKKREQRKKRNK